MLDVGGKFMLIFEFMAEETRCLVSILVGLFPLMRKRCKSIKDFYFAL